MSAIRDFQPASSGLGWTVFQREDQLFPSPEAEPFLRKHPAQPLEPYHGGVLGFLERVFSGIGSFFRSLGRVLTTGHWAESAPMNFYAEAIAPSGQRVDRIMQDYERARRELAQAEAARRQADEARPQAPGQQPLLRLAPATPPVVAPSVAPRGEDHAPATETPSAPHRRAEPEAPRAALPPAEQAFPPAAPVPQLPENFLNYALERFSTLRNREGEMDAMQLRRAIAGYNMRHRGTGQLVSMQEAGRYFDELRRMNADATTLDQGVSERDLRTALERHRAAGAL